MEDKTATIEDKFVFAFLGVLAAIATAGMLGIAVDGLGYNFSIIRGDALATAGLIGLGLASDVLLKWQ